MDPRYSFVFFLMAVYGIGAQLLYPQFRKSSPENVQLPTIAEEKIVEAFNYARDQAKLRMQTENHFIKNGHGISSTRLSCEQRMIGPISNVSQQNHRIQQQIEDATRYIVKAFKLSEDQTKFALPNITLPSDEPILEQCKKFLELKCDNSSKYRTADGSCNNVDYPNWGRAYAWYNIETKDFFADGISLPRKSATGCELPNARVISATVHRDLNVTSKDYTHMVAAFGQFVAHDIGQNTWPTYGDHDLPINCCPANSKITYPQNCLPIEIPSNDYFYSTVGRTCMDFQRVAAVSNDCKLGTPRRVTNQQTSFLDGSIIYDVTDEATLALRSKSKGKLLEQATPHGSLLPASQSPDEDQCSKTMGNYTCFQSGDPRVNSQLMLVSMHTVGFRHHNLIADVLAQDYPHATDETLFQEARSIFGAQMQAVTYTELLPIFLGQKLMKFFQLEVQEDGFTEYDPKTDPTVSNEFSQGVFRLGHSLIQNLLNKVDKHDKADGNLNQKYYMFHPITLYQGKLDELLRGFYHQGAQTYDRYFATDMTNHLFQVPYSSFGNDLVAIGIQRGRDTGIATYVSLLEYCFNVTIKTFADLNVSMSKENWQLLEKVYLDVNDIDLYTGVFCETPIEGALLGPTSACIVGKQFQDLKRGDRFYFEHGGQSGSFTPGQLKEIRKTTLAGILCQVSNGIETITRNVFRPISASNPQMPCSKIPAANFSGWFTK